MFTWKLVSNLVPNEFHTLFFVEHGFDARRKKIGLPAYDMLSSEIFISIIPAENYNEMQFCGRERLSQWCLWWLHCFICLVNSKTKNGNDCCSECVLRIFITRASRRNE